jgi:transketolase
MNMEMDFRSADLRRSILEMALRGGSGHIACAFSIVEILAVLYRSHLRLRRDDPLWPQRDYLVLSKGHGVMAQYACLREIGWVTDEDVQNYFGDGTRLKGLSDALIPGLEVSSGSLGHGLSVGVGLALAAKRLRTGQRTFAIVGDGEANEGSIWEALLFASQAGLGDLTVIIDANGLQAMGRTDDVLSLGNLVEKLRSFGCEAREIDGHYEPGIDQALNEFACSRSGRPKALVARTVKGKGVSFMEHDNRWHYTKLSPATYESALAEIDTGTFA